MAPLWEVVRLVRNNGSPRQWQLVLRHFLLAVSILCGMWLTAWMIGGFFTPPSGVDQHVSAPFVPAIPQVIGRRMALFTLTTLTVVLTGVEMLRLSRPVLERVSRLRRSTPHPAPHIAPADDRA